MKIIVHWVITAIAIAITAYILPGVHVDGFMAAAILALVLGAINGFLRPILVLLTLPLTIITFGFFILILNTLLIMLAELIVPGFALDGFWWAFIFGIVLTFLNAALFAIFGGKKV